MLQHTAFLLVLHHTKKIFIFPLLLVKQQLPKYENLWALYADLLAKQTDPSKEFITLKSKAYRPLSRTRHRIAIVVTFIKVPTTTYTKQLRTWALLLALEQGEQRGVGHLHDLETYSGNISDGVATATKARDEHLIVLLKNTTIFRETK